MASGQTREALTRRNESRPPADSRKLSFWRLTRNPSYWGVKENLPGAGGGVEGRLKKKKENLPANTFLGNSGQVLGLKILF